MPEVFVKERELVVPGDLLGKGMDILPAGGSYRDGEFIFANMIGLAEIKGSVIKVIPLAGRYFPNINDVVIGVVTNKKPTGWVVDVGAPYHAILPMDEVLSGSVNLAKEDIGKYYEIGDYVYGRIISISRYMVIKLSVKDMRPRKLVGGIIAKITPTKVPRVIGKKGSMISMLKNESGCEIIVGQNGWIWIKGKNKKSELKVVKAIQIIERESHVKGLTNKIKEVLER